LSRCEVGKEKKRVVVTMKGGETVKVTSVGGDFPFEIKRAGEKSGRFAKRHQKSGWGNIHSPQEIGPGTWLVRNKKRWGRCNRKYGGTVDDLE